MSEDNKNLPGSWATPDEAPESLRPFLVEHEGAHVLAIDVESDPRVRGMKRALDTHKGAATQAKTELDAWKRLGMGPKEVAASLEELTALRDSKGKGDADLQSRLDQVAKKYDSQLSERDEAVNALTSQLDGLLVDDAATRALLEDHPENNVLLLLPHIRAQSRVVVEGGKRKAIVVDSHGNPVVADVHGNHLDFAGLIQQMRGKPEFAAAFAAKTKPGSGTQPGSSTGGSGRATKRSDLRSDAEKTAFIDEHGLDAYRKLVAA